MPNLMISAAHKSSGKTIITLGICAALRAMGINVAPFKKGPDYIDPLWLSAASGRPCYNLDFWTMDHGEIRDTFACYACQNDFVLLEGNKGLYDGVDLDGSNSNAALAKLLDMPVILVIDTQGITRGIAPLVLGYQAFDPVVKIAGIILNKVGGVRHENKLRKVLAHYTNVQVIGAVAYDKRMTIVERHLGLVPSNETTAAIEQIEIISQIVAKQVDLDILCKIANHVPDTFIQKDAPQYIAASELRIGIPRDAAFAFYYPDDLDALQTAGAKLIFFNSLHDSLPEIDGLFIGGGFPEVQMDALANNMQLRTEIRNAIENGMPVYAECGGLMYLARKIQWADRQREMTGALPVDVIMTDKPIGRGYIYLQETVHHPWPVNYEQIIPGHEFHYSHLENIAPNLNFAYQIRRGFGIDGSHDGIVYRNVLACYSHQRNTLTHPWAQHFVNFVRAKKLQ